MRVVKLKTKVVATEKNTTRGQWDLMRGKTRVTKLRLVLILLLIGWREFWRPIGIEQMRARAKQYWITLYARLKIAGLFDFKVPSPPTRSKHCTDSFQK